MLYAISSLCSPTAEDRMIKNHIGNMVLFEPICMHLYRKTGESYEIQNER